MNHAAEIKRLLAEDEAVLLRHRKHRVYRLSNGALFTMATTASDERSDVNALQCLRRLLGLNKSEFTEGERRVKAVKRTNGYAPEKFTKPAFNSSLHDQLQAIGLTEDRLRDEIGMLSFEVETLRETVAAYEEELAEADLAIIVAINTRCGCWWCRVKGWLR